MLPSLSVEVLSPQGIERPTVRPASIGTETAAKAEDGVTALSSRTDQLMGEIEVRTEADIQRVSLGVRFFGNHSYAGTLGDRVRSFGSPSEIPKLDYDQEAFTYLIREPTQRLEIFLRTPDEAPPLHQLKVRSFVNVGTTLLPADEILSLSEFTVQSWPGAKRVRLTVKEPLQGVSYGLIWQLRDERPRLARERQKIDLAISQAEHVRRLMTQARTDGELSNHLRSTYYDDFFQKVLALAERTKLAEGNSRKKLDAIEVAILVPKSPLLSYADFEGTWNDPTRVRATPRLHAVSASYSPEDRRFLSAEMDVGCGIAGRAFAINDAAAYHADRDIALQGNEADPLSHASVYLQLRDESGTDIPRHSVLYAIPLRHWLHRSVVIGCVCIGAYGRTKLDLEGTDPLSKGDSAFDVVVRWGTELAKSLWEDGG